MKKSTQQQLKRKIRSHTYGEARTQLKKNESSQFPLLDQSTKKDELETSDENCTTPREKVDR